MYYIYLNIYIILLFQCVININILMRYFIDTKFSKSGMYFILTADLNLD